MKPTKRKDLFILAYTDVNCPKTYKNATQSALSSGYKASNAPSQGCKMTKNPKIAQEIERIFKDHKASAQKTVEDKIRITWENYEKAISKGKLSEAKGWFREHGELAGHYVQKTESKVSVEEAQKQVQDEIHSYINRLPKE